MDANGFGFTKRFRELRLNDVPADDQRWKDFFEDVAKYLCGIARRLIQSKEFDTKDLVQEVFVAILKKGPELARSDGHLTGWLATVCKNAIVSWMRKNRLRVRDPKIQDLERAVRDELGAILDVREVLELYVLVWEEMPAQCGINRDTVRAFLMRVRDRLEPKDVAKRQGISTATVNTSFSRTGKYLSAHLAEKLARKFDGESPSLDHIHEQVGTGELDARARAISQYAVRLNEVATHYGFAPDQGAIE